MNQTTESQPLVSVIIPAFNAEPTLRETVDSALGGSYHNIEVIIVDDGSTDSTAMIVRQLAATDARIRIHRHPKRGLSAALNSGFALARGDYVARLDADDLWHPAKLERQVELAVRQPELAFIYTWVRYVDEHGRVVRDGPAQQFPRWALCRGIWESLVGGGSSALMKRAAILEAGGCDESMKSFEDLWLQLKISARHPIGFEPGYLVAYRLRAGSLTTDTAKMLRTWRLVRNRLKLAFPQVPPWVDRWAHAKRCLLFAESFAWRRRYSPSAALVAEAVWHDARWACRYLWHRANRHLSRRFSPAAATSRHSAFFDCNPAHPIASAEQEVGGASVNRLECVRARKLAELDKALAAARPVGSSTVGGG